MRQQVYRYATIGAVNAAVGLLAIFGARAWLRMTDVAANATGYAVGLLISLVGNRSWAFRTATSVKADVVAFVGLAAAAYSANLLALLALRRGLGLNFYLAQTCSVLAYAGLLFVGLRCWADHGAMITRIGGGVLQPLRFHYSRLIARLDLVSGSRAIRTATYALMAVYFLFGVAIWIRDGANAAFYQNQMGPAVAFACTGKMLNIHGEPPEALTRFLERKSNSLRCVDVFPLPAGSSLGELNVHQNQSLGFLYGYGLLWKLMGMGWGYGALFSGAFFSLYFLGLALLGRLLAPPAISLAAAAVIAALDEKSHALLVHLRDFSKAPFILLLIYLCVVLWEAKRWRIVALAVATASVLAFALGFRNDVYVFLPLLLAVLAWKLALQAHNRLPSLVGISAFLVTLTVFKWIVFDYSLGAGRNMYHFYFLGLADQFQARMNVSEASYGFGGLSHDHFAHRATAQFSQATMGEDPPYGSIAYDRAGKAEFILHLRQFPADALSRAISAGFGALFNRVTLSPIAQFGVGIAAAGVLIIGGGVRALVSLALILALAHTTFVQFAPRHFFFYASIGWLLVVLALYWVVLFLLARFGSGRVRAAARESIEARAGSESVRVRLVLACLPLLGLVTILLALPMLRTYQAASLRSIHASLHAAASDPAAIEIASAGTGAARTLVRFEDAPHSRYVRLLFAEERGECQGDLRVSLNYTFRIPFFDWSQTIRPPGQTGLIYLPLLIEPGNNKPIEIAVTGVPKWCLTSASFIQLPPNVIPQFYFVSAKPGEVKPWVYSSLEHSLQRLLQSLTARRVCGERSPVVRGKAPLYRYSQSMTVPRLLEFYIDDGNGQDSSDHANLIDPVLVIDGQEHRVEDFRIQEAQLPYFKLKLGRNILDKPMSVDGTVYSRGFGAHAPARIAVAPPAGLQGKQGILRFGLGIDDQTQGAGSVAITVCLVD